MGSRGIYDSRLPAPHFRLFAVLVLLVALLSLAQSGGDRRGRAADTWNHQGGRLGASEQQAAW